MAGWLVQISPCSAILPAKTAPLLMLPPHINTDWACPMSKLLNKDVYI